MILPLLACLILATPALAEDAPLIARGNEPGWVLTLAPEGMVLSSESGERVETPLPRALPLGTGCAMTRVPIWRSRCCRSSATTA